MAVVAAGKPSITITYTLTDTSSTVTATESTVVGNTITFANGDGTGAVNMGVTASGFLSAGGTTTYDLTSFPKTSFGSTTNLNFSSGVKALVITNTWNGSGQLGIPTGFPLADIPHITVGAAGANGFTNLFNGETGNIKINPASSWSYVDYIGVNPTASNKYLSLTDTSGSGCSFEIVVVGVTGA